MEDEEVEVLLQDLQVASGVGDCSRVNLLLEAGLSVDLADGEGVTALHIAAAAGHLKLVEHLIARGASVNHYSFYGWTALMHAAYHGHTDIVRLFLEAEPTAVNAQNSLGASALTMAIRSGHEDVVRLLLDYSADVCLPSVLMAILQTRDSILDLLLERYVDVNTALDYTGLTPLMLASVCGQEAMAKSLVERGADSGRKDARGRTAADLAQDVGSDSIRAILTDSSAGDYHTGDTVRFEEVLKMEHSVSELNNALLQAAQIGPEYTLRTLVTRGADVNTTDERTGWTPLMVAAYAGKMGIVKCLLDLHAEPLRKSVDGFTAFDLAIFGGNASKPLLLLLAQKSKAAAPIAEPSGVITEETAEEITPKRHLRKPAWLKRIWRFAKKRLKRRQGKGKGPVASDSVGAPELSVNVEGQEEQRGLGHHRRPPMATSTLSLSRLMETACFYDYSNLFAHASLPSSKRSTLIMTSDEQESGALTSVVSLTRGHVTPTFMTDPNHMRLSRKLTLEGSQIDMSINLGSASLNLASQSGTSKSSLLGLQEIKGKNNAENETVSAAAAIAAEMGGMEVSKSERLLRDKMVNADASHRERSASTAGTTLRKRSAVFGSAGSLTEASSTLRRRARPPPLAGLHAGPFMPNMRKRSGNRAYPRPHSYHDPIADTTHWNQHLLPKLHPAPAPLTLPRRHRAGQGGSILSGFGKTRPHSYHDSMSSALQSSLMHPGWISRDLMNSASYARLQVTPTRKTVGFFKGPQAPLPPIFSAGYQPPLTQHSSSPHLATGVSPSSSSGGASSLFGNTVRQYYRNGHRHTSSYEPMSSLETVTIEEDELQCLLRKLSLEQYHTVFEEQEVDVETFLLLTDSDLREIGIRDPGPRHEILQAVRNINLDMQLRRTLAVGDHMDYAGDHMD